MTLATALRLERAGVVLEVVDNCLEEAVPDFAFAHALLRRNRFQKLVLKSFVQKELAQSLGKRLTTEASRIARALERVLDGSYIFQDVLE